MPTSTPWAKPSKVFGELFKRQPSLRARLQLQSKCSIRFADAAGPKRYDLSAEYVIASVEASLKRMHTDHIEVLLLHRPDPLMEAAELAEAWTRLKAAGKVGRLGVSNMHAGADAHDQCRHWRAPGGQSVGDEHTQARLDRVWYLLQRWPGAARRLGLGRYAGFLPARRRGVAGLGRHGSRALQRGCACRCAGCGAGHGALGGSVGRARVRVSRGHRAGPGCCAIRWASPR